LNRFTILYSSRLWSKDFKSHKYEYLQVIPQLFYLFFKQKKVFHQKLKFEGEESVSAEGTNLIGSSERKQFFV